MGYQLRAVPRDFRPHPVRDRNGLSVLRRAFIVSPREAANRGPGKRTYFASLRTGDVRATGLDVVPAPEVDNPAHCLMPQLNAETGKQDWALEAQEILAQRVVEVLGPYDGFDRPTAPRGTAA